MKEETNIEKKSLIFHLLPLKGKTLRKRPVLRGGGESRREGKFRHKQIDQITVLKLRRGVVHDIVNEKSMVVILDGSLDAVAHWWT